MSSLAGPPCSREQSQLLPCPTCPFHGPKVGSRGDPKSSIVWIGEAGGRDEMSTGLPVTGASGRVFWHVFPKMLSEWGLDPGEFFVLNSMQCVPPRIKDDQKKSTENLLKGAQACHSRLIDQVQQYPRKLIVAMGNHATWSLTGNRSLKITQIRGQLIPSPLAELGILPVLNPAALLHGSGNFRQFRMDIEYAIDLIRGFPPKAPQKAFYLVCDTKEKVLNAIRRLVKAKYIFVDTETTGLNRFRDQTLLLGLAKDPRLVYIFTGRIRKDLPYHPSWEDITDTIPWLQEFFKKCQARFVFHNGKFDVSFTRNDGCETRVDEDTMLLSYAHDEQGGIHDLEQVSSDLLGSPDWKYILKEWCPKRSDSYQQVPLSILCNYLALDVSNTSQIFPILRRRIGEDPALEKLYTRLLIPASEALWWVEHRGITANKLAVERQQKRLQGIIDAAGEVLQEEAQKFGYTQWLNPGSPQQMASLIFDHLNLQLPRGVKRSTNKDVLKLLPKHPVVECLRDFRAAQKAKGTYADTILKNMEADGRVHPTLLLHGTRTGRLAHKIIANIPRDRRIRGMYCAAQGYILVKCDEDQAELRALAALSGDPELCAIYRSNKRKLHVEVSDDIWGTGGDKDGVRGPTVSWGLEEYMRAKALNFGIIYGRQAESIAVEFGIQVKEAQRYIDYWRKKFPVAWAFLEKCRQAVFRGQTLVTPFGNKKRHWIITKENLHGLQNEACNFPFQNVASNIALDAAIHAGPQLRELDAWTVLLVHDELLIECPDNLSTINQVQEIVLKEIEAAPRRWGITRIPFKGDISIGHRWGIYLKDDKNNRWQTYLEHRDSSTGQSLRLSPARAARAA
jgi:DNA polymerase I